MLEGGKASFPPSNGPLELSNVTLELPMKRWNLPTQRRSFQWTVGNFQRGVGTSDGLLELSNVTLEPSKEAPDLPT